MMLKLRVFGSSRFYANRFVTSREIVRMRFRSTSRSRVIMQVCVHRNESSKSNHLFSRSRTEEDTASQLLHFDWFRCGSAEASLSASMFRVMLGTGLWGELRIGVTWRPWVTAFTNHADFIAPAPILAEFQLL